VGCKGLLNTKHEPFQMFWCKTCAEDWRTRRPGIGCSVFQGSGFRAYSVGSPRARRVEGLLGSPGARALRVDLDAVLHREPLILHRVYGAGCRIPQGCRFRGSGANHVKFPISVAKDN